MIGKPTRHIDRGRFGAEPFDTVGDNAALLLRELFCFDTAASVADFAAVDDRVMGGRSVSRLRHDPAGHAGATMLCIEVLGDGKRYKLNLRTDDLFDGVAYQSGFHPAPGAWQVLRQLGLAIGDRQVGAFALALRSIVLQ